MASTPASISGTSGRKLAHVRRRIALVREQLLQHRPFRKRRPASEHEKQRAAERVNVAANIGIARVAGLFGADVVERSKRDARRRFVVLGLFRRIRAAPGPCRPASPGHRA